MNVFNVTLQKRAHEELTLLLENNLMKGVHIFVKTYLLANDRNPTQTTWTVLSCLPCTFSAEWEGKLTGGGLYESHSSVFWMRDLLYPGFCIIPGTKIHVCLQDEHVTLRVAVYSCVSCSLYKPLFPVQAPGPGWVTMENQPTFPLWACDPKEVSFVSLSKSHLLITMSINPLGL